MVIPSTVVDLRYLAVVHTLSRALIMTNGEVNRNWNETAGTGYRREHLVGADNPYGYEGPDGSDAKGTRD